MALRVSTRLRHALHEGGSTCRPPPAVLGRRGTTRATGTLDRDIVLVFVGERQRDNRL